MKIAYFDCFSGASGDMIIAALLNAGLPFNKLKKSLDKLHIKPALKLRHHHAERCGLVGTRFDLLTPNKHLSYKKMTAIIKRSSLSAPVKSDSLKILARLMSAEKRVHHDPRRSKQLEFAELGSIDTVVDIVGAVSGFEALDIDKIYVSPLPLSRGTIKSHHGIYPVPGPATMELLKGFEVFPSPVQFELVTPTGAAILTTLGQPVEQMPVLKAQKTGYGAGTMEIPNQPNILRLIIGETAVDAGSDTVMVLETNLDTVTGQTVGYLIEQLLAAGALDVIAIPVQMKKSRPGILLQVLCTQDGISVMERMIFTETGTLGIRRYPVQRTKLHREVSKVKTPYGIIRLKTGRLDGKLVSISPEYDDCRQAAQKYNVPLKKVISETSHRFHRLQSNKVKE
jgi:uncharacterized protein (TIGR00299 family) protein